MLNGTHFDFALDAAVCEEGDGSAQSTGAGTGTALPVPTSITTAIEEEAAFTSPSGSWSGTWSWSHHHTGSGHHRNSVTFTSSASASASSESATSTAIKTGTTTTTRTKESLPSMESTKTTVVATSTSATQEQPASSTTVIPSSTKLSSGTTSSSILIPSSTKLSSGTTSSTIPIPSSTLSSSTSATCTPVTGATCTQQNASLVLHNEARKAHGATPLIWNSTLASAALKWSEECVWEHSGGSLLPGGYGENLYEFSEWSISSDGTKTPIISDDMGAAVTAWVNEESQYDFSNPGFSEATGHFTQVVWLATTSVGCALNWCATNQTSYTVCEYYPEGNVIGEFAANVLAS